jgi:SNF2 family DNA or RNA helicase
MIPGTKYNEVPPKLNLLLNNLTELIDGNRSAVVFTNFVATLNVVKVELTKKGIPVLSFSGSSSSKQRKEILQEFNQNDQAYVLIMTLKTGMGVGLNLTKANYIFHIEPWWNPSVESQATDRVHRIGQKRSVQVYKYIMKDSF